MITVRGRYTLRTNKRGIIAEFSNVITDIGMDRLPLGDWINRAVIGTGEVPAKTDDTALGSRQATATTVIAENTINAGQAPWKKRYYITYRFAAGTDLDENLEYSEIGVGWADDQLFSRSLIKDNEGEPTTITVLDDEYLDVIYVLEIAISSSSAPYSFVYNGTTYTGTIKAAGATSNDVVPADAIAIASGNAYDGALGGIGGFPAGNTQALTPANDAYVAGTYTHTGQARLVASSLTQVESLAWTYSGLGVSYQADFDTPLETDGWTISLFVSLTWARA